MRSMVSSVHALSSFSRAESAGGEETGDVGADLGLHHKDRFMRWEQHPLVLAALGGVLCLFFLLLYDKDIFKLRCKQSKDTGPASLCSSTRKN